MKRKARTHRILVLLGILLAPFVAVHVQEMVFRHRVERLLADMRSLMVHKANMTEIQAVFKRWDPDGHPCFDQCMLEADSWRSNFMVNRILSPDEATTTRPGLWPLLFKIYGGQRAHVFATGSVDADGVPWISFSVTMDIYSRRNRDEDELAGQAASVARFSILDAWWGLTLHSNYIIGDQYARWHRGTVGVEAKFGPHADPTDIARFVNFDLSCLTRLVPCRKPEDLMPAVAAQDAKEEPRLERARMDHACGPDIVGLMARDARYAGVAEVTATRPLHTMRGRDAPIITVRMMQSLAPVRDWKPGESRDLGIDDANTYLPATSFPPEVRPGNRFIILADSAFSGGDFFTERCGILPLNPTNLELVRNAIAGNIPPAKP